MMLEKLVIFDYSGTLSLDAVSFGEDDNLTGELERSGLAGLGIADPETFWEEIVNPAWQEGSTTSVGYTELIYRTIRENLPPAVSNNTIRLSAERFVDSYLRHSSIDSRWHSILQKLNSETSAVTVIATDHYAEATGYIVGFLAEMGIGSISLRDASGACVSPVFIVANSADMGAHKVDRAFWDTLKGPLGLDGLCSVLIVDDFGFNEEAGDSYANRQKVEDRKSKTIGLLERIFTAPVCAIPFVLAGKDDKTRGNLIMQASLEIERWLK